MGGVELLTVFKGRDNSPSRVFSHKGLPLAFVDLGVGSLSVVLNSVEYSSSDGYVEFDNTGRVTFKLHKLTVYPTSIEVARLVAYDEAHPRGKIILSELSNQKLAFQFV